jgi:hypothetical protein
MLRWPENRARECELWEDPSETDQCLADADHVGRDRPDRNLAEAQLMNRMKKPILAFAALLLAAGSTVSAAADHEIWVLDQIIYPTQKDPGILAEIEKTHSIDAVIAVLKSHKIRFGRQSKRLDPKILPPDIYAQIEALPAGEPFIAPASDLSVASVIVSRESNPAAGKQ